MSSGSNSVTLIMIAIGLGAMVLSNNADRTRIRENVKARGGKVIAIQAHSFLTRGLFYERPYRVSYMTGEGRHVMALCYTNRSSGVRWVTDHPPGT